MQPAGRGCAMTCCGGFRVPAGDRALACSAADSFTGIATGLGDAAGRSFEIWADDIHTFCDIAGIARSPGRMATAGVPDRRQMRASPRGRLTPVRHLSPARRGPPLPRSPGRMATAGLPDRRQMRIVTPDGAMYEYTEQAVIR